MVQRNKATIGFSGRLCAAFELPFQLIQNNALRPGHVTGFDQGFNQFLLLFCKLDSHPTQGGQTFNGIVQRLANLDR